jgi:hypothetical protein
MEQRASQIRALLDAQRGKEEELRIRFKRHIFKSLILDGKDSKEKFSHLLKYIRSFF